MGVFITLYFVIIAFSFLEINIKALRFGGNQIEVRKVTFWIITILILLIGILKDEYLGVDAHAYEQNYFDLAKYRGWIDIATGLLSDKGFYLLTKCMTLISGDFWVYNALLYTVVFFVEAYVIYKNSKYPAISYLVFTSLGLVIFNYSLLRQAVAVSICFFAFQYIEKRKPVKFVLWTFMAATFHQTAILYLVAYPVANLNIKGYAFWKKVLLFVGALVTTRFMPMLLQFYNKEDYSGAYIAGEGYFLLLYYAIFIAFIAWLMSKGQLKKEGQIIYNVLFCILYFQIGAVSFSVFTRVVNYFFIALILIIPFIVEKAKSKNTILIIFTSILAFRYILVISVEKYVSIWG